MLECNHYVSFFHATCTPYSSFFVEACSACACRSFFLSVSPARQMYINTVPNARFRLPPSMFAMIQD